MTTYQPTLCPCCGRTLAPGLAKRDASNQDVFYCRWCARPSIVVVNDEGDDEERLPLIGPVDRDVTLSYRHGHLVAMNLT